MARTSAMSGTQRSVSGSVHAAAAASSTSAAFLLPLMCTYPDRRAGPRTCGRKRAWRRRRRAATAAALRAASTHQQRVLARLCHRWRRSRRGCLACCRRPLDARRQRGISRAPWQRVLARVTCGVQARGKDARAAAARKRAHADAHTAGLPSQRVRRAAGCSCGCSAVGGGEATLAAPLRRRYWKRRRRRRPWRAAPRFVVCRGAPLQEE